MDAAKRGDYATALREWKPLAEQGYAVAQYNLGVMYANGQGVSQNHKTAVKWYTRAAEQGHASAQYNLGVMYANGLGTPENFIRAHMWWNIAALQGLKIAKKWKEKIAKMMTPAHISEAQDLARECVRKNYRGC